MKKSILFLLLLLSLGAASQNIDVKSFRLLVGNMTTTSKEGKRIDQNNQVAALIKIVTTETGFTFEAGALGVLDTKQETGEVWVWVPRGSRKITIKHQQLGILRDYRYPIEIEADRTYEMVLTTAKIETIVKETVRMQYLGFQITPPNATLWVNDEIWELETDGTATRFLNFGTYDWRVQAPNYHPDAGRVTLKDANKTELITVNMKPNFGWIEMTGDGPLNDASVYIDDNFIGKAPCKSEALKSGQHTVRVVKKMYATYSQTVTVNDNETLKLAPALIADFAEVTLKVDADADIYVNDERKGTRIWTGALGSGTYKIECKMANHETTQTTKEITPNMNGQTITLPAPRPIYGSLNVESSPNFCQLFIDGKLQGNTPKFIPEILVGRHEIKLTKEGYSDHVETVVIQKNEQTVIKAVLDNMREVRFVCNVPNATVEVDGVKSGTVSGSHRMKDGVHQIAVKAKGYVDYDGSISVSADKTEFTVNMQKKIKEQFTFVSLNGAYSVAPQLSYGISVGNVKRFGWFVSVMTNGNFTGFSAKANCDAEGFLTDGTLPNYSGEAATGRNSIIIGGLVQVAKPLYLRAGVGYGMRSLCWKADDGSYYRNVAYSTQGIDLSGGMQAHFGSIMVSAEVVTTNFKTLEGKMGLGLAF